MSFDDWAPEQEVRWKLTVTVNDVVADSRSDYDVNTLIAQTPKMEEFVAMALEDQYQDMLDAGEDQHGD